MWYILDQEFEKKNIALKQIGIPEDEKVA